MQPTTCSTTPTCSVSTDKVSCAASRHRKDAIFRQCRDPQTAYKIAALYDAVVERRTSAHLLWIDSDAYFQRPLDAAFWGWAAQFDVAAIFRRGTGSMLMPYSPNTPETGVVFFNAASTATQQLMRDARLALFNTSEYMKASSVNDVSIFNLLLRRANPRATFARSPSPQPMPPRKLQPLSPSPTPQPAMDSLQAPTAIVP